jgi:hypothetical protein
MALVRTLFLCTNDVHRASFFTSFLFFCVIFLPVIHVHVFLFIIVIIYIRFTCEFLMRFSSVLVFFSSLCA